MEIRPPALVGKARGRTGSYSDSMTMDPPEVRRRRRLPPEPMVPSRLFFEVVPTTVTGRFEETDPRVRKSLGGGSEMVRGALRFSLLVAERRPDELRGWACERYGLARDPAGVPGRLSVPPMPICARRGRCCGDGVPRCGRWRLRHR